MKNEETSANVREVMPSWAQPPRTITTDEWERLNRQIEHQQKVIVTLLALMDQESEGYRQMLRGLLEGVK